MSAVGLDRSIAMLRIARRRCPAARWVKGDGAQPPFGDGAFDFITSQFSYQHVRRTQQLVREVFRLLAPGGQFVMTNIDPWRMRNWLVYQYFPEAFELDTRDFVEVDAFVERMRAAGFTEITVARADSSMPRVCAGSSSTPASVTAPPS